MVLTHLFVHEYFKQICKTTFKNEVYIVCGMFFVPHEQYAIKMYTAQHIGLLKAKLNYVCIYGCYDCFRAHENILRNYL